MCIRDRDEQQGVAGLDDDAAQKRQERVAKQALDGVHRGEASRPVSYTHLRAHETVLDLVCRLLLAKKTLTLITDDYTSAVNNLGLHIISHS